MSGLNGTKPAHAVTEVVACRRCGQTKAIPAHRPRTWIFTCSGCGAVIEVDLS